MLTQDDSWQWRVKENPLKPTITQKRQKSIWRRVRATENSYAIKLRKIADNIGHLINGVILPVEGAIDLYDASVKIYSTLQKYSEILGPWAESVARSIVAEIAARDASAWVKTSESMGQDLKTVINTAPIGTRMEQLVREQVGLIKSLPLEAAERVQTLAIKSVHEGMRPSAIVEEILKTGHVTRSRATLIARTETGRASTALTRARSEHVGSTHYKWLSAHDNAVRPMHRKLDGTIQSWNDPPIAEENGIRHHPGEFPNCRCVAIPVLPPVNWE